MTNNDHRRTAYTMTKKQNEQHDSLSCCSFCFFGHCVGCPSVIVVFHVVYFVFLSLCRLSFCDRCLSCCSFCFLVITTTTEGQPTQWPKKKRNNMTNNDHRRTAYTMTKKQNKQHDKQWSLFVMLFIFFCWSLCRLSFCDRCLSCCSFCFLVIV
jgi:hypothetical protein